MLIQVSVFVFPLGNGLSSTLTGILPHKEQQTKEPLTLTTLVPHLISQNAQPQLDMNSTSNKNTSLWTYKQNTSAPLPIGRYAVISCSTPMNDFFNYAFMLPLTVRSWSRVQYKTLVLIAGSRAHWDGSFTLQVVLEELYMLGAYVIFIETSYEHTIMVSQTSRLLACNLVTWEDASKSVLVTSDADLWPMMAGAYDLADGKKILSLNSECCGSVSRHNSTFKMIPMGNVAMSVAQWCEVMNISQSQPLDSVGILKYFHKEFGDDVYLPTHKGENDGWYMDQIMLSMRIEQWLHYNDINKTTIQYVPRDTGRDRIDRQSWSFSMSLHRVVDCHVLEDAYKRGTWERLYALLRLMYSPLQLEIISEYRHRFVRTLPEFSYLRGV